AAPRAGLFRPLLARAAAGGGLVAVCRLGLAGASRAVYAERRSGLFARSRPPGMDPSAPAAAGVCLLSFRLRLRVFAGAVGLCGFAARPAAHLHRADAYLAVGLSADGSPWLHMCFASHSARRYPRRSAKRRGARKSQLFHG